MKTYTITLTEQELLDILVALKDNDDIEFLQGNKLEVIEKICNQMNKQ